MTSLELYYEFSSLVNKNSERENINISKGNFVKLYNRERLKWLYDYIDKFNSSDNIQSISELFIKDYELSKNAINNNYVSYDVPKDLFSLIHGNNYSIVEKNDCKGIIYNYFRKPNDLNVSLKHKYTRPSFQWERGLGEITEKGIIVYFDDFLISKSYVSYYKEPTKIDIEGYIDVEGEYSKTINPTESQWIVERILDKTVTEVQREFENQIGFQVSKERES